MPPPPSPLPDAVAQVAAGLLLAPERPGPAGLPVVAGYEILGPLGRGGMGLVYQARQLQGGRVVALKMIRGGPHAGPHDLARFRTEAEAVARLQHPHIVPIYEAGEHDGWAYVALELAPGGSLARRLAGRPQPAGPSARLVEALARAMEHAHARGILHRDLKPANVLLAADGTPKISDFGLAKRLGPERGTSARDRTQTGEVLGTPSYMAPEQTWGRPGEVGPAADVYALGAILYECLTGRPPFQAATPLDTLLQVRTDEPVPPRRLVPSVPRDLDALCLKCLHKDPRRRYPSAGALAEDLRRFLAGGPVQARPAGAWERATRWARRRKAAAALLAVSGVAVLSLLTFGVWHHVQLQGRNAELHAEQENANHQRALAEAKEKEARQQKAEAEKQWRRAETNFQAALSAFEVLLARVSEVRLADEPRMELVRRQLLEDALRFFQKVLKQNSTDPLLRVEMAYTYLRVGDIQKELGQQAAAEEAYNAAIPLFRALAAEFPQRHVYRHHLAGCYNNRGGLWINTPRRKEAEGAFHRALAIQQALVDEAPKEVEYRVALAGTHHNLGTLLTEARRLGEAEKALSRALDHRRRLAEERPRNARYRQDLARTYHNLGNLLARTNRLGEAEQAHRRALDLQRKLAEDFPRVAAYRQELAGSHNGLAIVLDATKRLGEAETEYAQALALQQRLADDFPRVPAYRQELAHSHHNRALLLEQLKRPQEAEQACRRALDIQQRLVDELPGVPRQHHELGRMFDQLAGLLLVQGRPADARRNAERAVQHQQAALKLVPGQPAYQRALGRHYRVLAEALLRLGDHAAAAQAAAELPRYVLPADQGCRYAAGALARCVPLAERDPALPAEARRALALAYGDRAMALLRRGLVQAPRAAVDQVKTTPYLAPLRPRPDFQRLVRELEEAGRSGAK
jgi:tetratricopeptide (TPR) repeat protein